MDADMLAGTSAPIRPEAAGARPYAPSFVDRFMGFIERLPGPFWLTCLVAFLLQSTIAHVLAWIDGSTASFTFNPLLLLFPVWLWAPIAIMIYLNSISAHALSSFSKLMDIEEEQLNGLKYEFTTMPGRSVILSGLFWVVAYVVLTAITFDTFYVGYGLGTLLSIMIFVEGLISYFVGSAVYYHSLRQLRLINRTVKMVSHLSLFRLDPVYAFSRVTARTGVGWMLMLSLTLLLFPMRLASAPVVGVLAVQVLLALAAFVLPLQFVNQRLVAEKRALLADHGRRMEDALARLHQCLDTDEMGEAPQLGSALAGLNVERDVLNKLPTWPWRPGTLTGFLSAIGLPLILFLIQRVIGRWLGG